MERGALPWRKFVARMCRMACATWKPLPTFGTITDDATPSESSAISFRKRRMAPISPSASSMSIPIPRRFSGQGTGPLDSAPRKTTRTILAVLSNLKSGTSFLWISNLKRECLSAKSSSSLWTALSKKVTKAVSCSRGRRSLPEPRAGRHHNRTVWSVATARAIFHFLIRASSFPLFLSVDGPSHASYSHTHWFPLLLNPETDMAQTEGQTRCS